MEEGNKYKYSRAYHKILQLILDNPDEDVFVIRGGQGASKTISIIELIIQSLLSSEKEATILSSELSKMKRTVVRDYRKVCKDWGVMVGDNGWNKSECKHEYDNGSYLDFLGADVNDIGKGFRRDILYINEADKMDIDTAVQFISRAKLTIIDYNPDSLFWGDDYINDNNFISLTFEDNEFLDESEKRSILDYKQKGFHNPDLPYNELFQDSNIKSKYWANKWRVYGLGEVGSIDGVVFENWSEIDELPKEARLLCVGGDFGYETSKFAALNIYYWNGHYVLDEIIYANKLTNQDAADTMKRNGYISGTISYFDYAEPKSIEELQRAGINAVPCESKQDIKPFAIQKLNSKEFYVTKKSVNLVNELRYYVYDEKTGKPKKSDRDHLMDALLYGVGSEGKYSGNYSIG